MDAKNFCVENATDSTDKKPVGRPKELENPVSFSVIVDKKTNDYIRETAKKMGLSVSALVRYSVWVANEEKIQNIVYNLATIEKLKQENEELRRKVDILTQDMITNFFMTHIEEILHQIKKAKKVTSAIDVFQKYKVPYSGKDWDKIMKLAQNLAIQENLKCSFF
jgi:microsomal dipeptidase-like Zn-dependent dipeptidase